VGASLKLDPSNIKPIQAIEYPLPAPRPMNSRMSAQKLKKAIEARADVSKLQRWDTSWTEQVRTYVQALVKEQVI
jgi:dTDP-4-dehydrorhamnose reductase